ncbi:MAG: cardiolipin synthase, partial [Clostridia bacterium]|nr:cardiolipin synthase [Clostridia bacterium]
TGTTNIDYRSFNLNFEISTIIYDKEFIDNVVKLFEKDVESSSIVEVEDFKHRSAFDKLQQVFFRLFSPLM